MGKRIFTFFLYIVSIFTVASGQQKYVERALKYISKDKIEKAKETLRFVDLENSDSYIADYYLAKGYVYDAEDKKDSAIMMYQKLIDLKALNDIPNKVLVDYAAYKYNSGFYEEALMFIKEVNANVDDTKYPIILDRINEKAYWAKENQFNYSNSLGHDSIIDVALGANNLVIDVPRFGAAFYQDSLVFASYTEKRKPTRTEEEAFEYNQIRQDYERTNTDLYIASLDDKFEDRKIFADELKSIENEGALTFNADYTEMYYTRNEYRRGEERYMIYYAKKEGNEWIDKGPLNFNSDKFNTMHPAISPDGKGIYFVSNNPGGYGGYDIYYAEGKGTDFKKPLNLGPEINSTENEIFPYMQNDSVMIYSSNGQPGFGGYDIFWVDIKKGDRKPHNLLQPINSVSDDYCIVGNRTNPEQMLFFSDRDVNMHNLALNLSKESLAGEALSFKISLLPPNKKAKLKDDSTLLANKDQNSLLASKVKEYNNKYGITNNDLSTTTGTGTSNQSANLLLDKNGNVVKDSNGNPIFIGENGVVLSKDGKTLLDKNGDPILDKDGNPVVVDNAVDIFDAGGNVLIAEVKKGEGDNGTTSTGGNQETTIGSATGEGAGAEFASLYFNLNSTSLSEEAKTNLKMVAEYLKAKPAMKLVVTGHAGLRGNESYNLVISANRAYQTYEFLTKELGISGESIILKADGKYFPSVRTFDVQKGIENRRVDIAAQWEKPNSNLNVKFKITGKYQEELLTNLFKLHLEQNPEQMSLIIAQRGKGIYRTAVDNGISVETLKKLNNLGSRDYLFENEIIKVKELETNLKDMIFEVRVKTLFYTQKETDVYKVANQFNVSADKIKKVNNLAGDTVKAHSRLIIPIE